MRKNLTIKEFEHKVTKAGKPYIRINTEEGWISCFDKGINEGLIKNVGNVVEVEVAESKSSDGEMTFKNIKGLYENDDINKTPIKIEDKPKAGNGTSKEFHLSIEECRARALGFALQLESPRNDEEAFEILKNKFFEWVWKGV